LVKTQVEEGLKKTSGGEKTLQALVSKAVNTGDPQLSARIDDYLYENR
jgi:hypothetical protein